MLVGTTNLNTTLNLTYVLTDVVETLLYDLRSEMGKQGYELRHDAKRNFNTAIASIRKLKQDVDKTQFSTQENFGNDSDCLLAFIRLLVKTLLESSQWFSPARRLKWEAKPLFSEKITEKEYCYDKSMLSKPSVKTLSEKDIPSNRCLFRLVPSERPTEETGCGLLPTVQTQGLKMCDENGKTRFYPMELLPTPMASDATTGAIIGKNDHFITTGNGTPRKINQNGINGSVGLARMVQLLPTPNAREADKYSKKYNPNSQMGTALTAMTVNGMLPTPTNSMVTYQDFIQAGYHSSKRPDYGLIPTPTASSHHNGCCKERKDGTSRKSQLNHYIAAQTGKTSQLNPLFVEEMMGFPLMWTTLPFLSQSGDRNQSKDTETP